MGRALERYWRLSPAQGHGKSSTRVSYSAFRQNNEPNFTIAELKFSISEIRFSHVDNPKTINWRNEDR
jgi:hypothetical protein